MWPMNGQGSILQLNNVENQKDYEHRQNRTFTDI